MSASKIFIATLLLTSSLYTTQSYAQSEEGQLQMLFKKATGQTSETTNNSEPENSNQEAETTENSQASTLEEKLANTPSNTPEGSQLPTRNTLPNPSANQTETSSSPLQETTSNLPVIPQAEQNNINTMAPGNTTEENPSTDIPDEKVELPKVTAPELNNLDQINNLNSEIAILELELKKAQLNKDIKTAQKEEKEASGENVTQVAPAPQPPQPQPQQQSQLPEGAYPPGMLPQLNNNMQNMQMNNQQNQMPQKSAADYEREALPIVNLVSGTNNNLTARLLLLGGNSQIVKEGTKIPGGFTVKSIKTDSVILKGDASGQDHVLTFGNHYPQPVSQNSSNMNNNAPLGSFNPQGFQGIPY